MQQSDNVIKKHEAAWCRNCAAKQW